MATQGQREQQELKSCLIGKKVVEVMFGKEGTITIELQDERHRDMKYYVVFRLEGLVTHGQTGQQLGQH